MRTRPARLLTHVPSVEAERPVGGCAGREVVRRSAGAVGHLGRLRHRPEDSAGLSAVAEISRLWVGHPHSFGSGPRGCLWLGRFLVPAAKQARPAASTPCGDGLVSGSSAGYAAVSGAT